MMRVQLSNKRKIALLLSLLLILLLTIYKTRNSKHKEPIRLRIEENIRAVLPTGSDFTSVQFYLEKSQIPYHWYEEEKYFSAFIRDVAYRWPFTESMTIELYMSIDKTLKRIEVISSLTGP
jgi:hypothetical protein